MASAVKARYAKSDGIAGAAGTDGRITRSTDPKGDAICGYWRTDGPDAAGPTDAKGDATSASDGRIHWPLADMVHIADGRGCADAAGRAGPCMPPDCMASDGRETGE